MGDAVEPRRAFYRRERPESSEYRYLIFRVPPLYIRERFSL